MPHPVHVMSSCQCVLSRAYCFIAVHHQRNCMLDHSAGHDVFDPITAIPHIDVFHKLLQFCLSWSHEVFHLPHVHYFKHSELFQEARMHLNVMSFIVASSKHTNSVFGVQTPKPIPEESGRCQLPPHAAKNVPFAHLVQCLSCQVPEAGNFCCFGLDLCCSSLFLALAARHALCKTIVRSGCDRVAYGYVDVSCLPFCKLLSESVQADLGNVDVFKSRSPQQQSHQHVANTGCSKKIAGRV
jgi:hypothetical protein